MLKITKVIALVVGSMAIAPAVLADTPPGSSGTTPTTRTGVANADKSSDINKQIGLIDLYLTDAMNDAKYLSTFADAAPGAGDKTIVAEAHRNLDMAIDRSLTHVQKLKTYKNDLSMAAGTLGSSTSGMMRNGGSSTASGSTGSATGSTPGSTGSATGSTPGSTGPATGSTSGSAASDGKATVGAPGAMHDETTSAGMGSSDKLARVDELERHLKAAKAASKKLATAQTADLSAAVDGVASHLMGADAAFREVARWTNYTRLANQNLSTVPVRGDETPAGDINRDLDKNRPGSSGSMGTPGSSSPGTTGEDRNVPGGTKGDLGTPPTRTGTSPGTTTPGTTSPGTTTPPSAEPTQPAPGTGSPATGTPGSGGSGGKL